jgi:hypothetical protein
MQISHQGYSNREVYGRPLRLTITPIPLAVKKLALLGVFGRPRRDAFCCLISRALEGAARIRIR